MSKPNTSKALADTILKVSQQVQCNKPSQQLKLNSRVLASTIIQALYNHSLIDISTWITWRMNTSIRTDHRPINELNSDDLTAQMNDVLNVRKISNKKISRKSKLDPYRAELIFFQKNGNSLNEMRDWLRRYQRIQVNRSTISRKLDEWNSYGKT